MRLKIKDRFRFFKSISLLILIIALISSFFISFKVDYDPNYINEHDLIFKTTDTNISEYKQLLHEQINDAEDNFAKGDIYLILARLENNSAYYKEACKRFISHTPNPITYETLASLNCKNKADKWLKLAADNSDDWKKELLNDISNNRTNLIFETSTSTVKLNLTNANKISIGNSQITINKNNTIVTQQERVLRDWLTPNMTQSPFEGEPLYVFSEKNYYTEDELRSDIGWHEGGRLKDIKDNININHVSAVGTVVALNPDDNKWYASDENGVFRFEIPIDKIYYPTTRFIRKDIAIIIDTHGVNMLVDQAITSNADVVIGCCDFPGKIKAAVYLANKNISVICNTDRYLYQALGRNLSILGSPPMKTASETVVFGNRPLEIERNQKIAVLNTEKGYPQQYYDAPYKYFSEINKTFPLDLYIINIDGYNQTHQVLEVATINDANIVGYRVFNSYDYNEAKQWLEKSDERKMVLFHSSSYPYGKLLAEEYPEQTTFDDPNPRILLPYSK